MKRPLGRILFVPLLLATILTVATAQVDPDADGIGIYFDVEATEHCREVPLFAPFTMHLVLTRASETAGVAGWECLLEYDPAMLLVMMWEVHNYSGSALDPPEFLVGLETPLVWVPAINLMNITAMAMTDQCQWLSIAPVTNPSLPGEVVYASAADPLELIPMHPSTGGFGMPVAGINCDCPPPVSDRATTWSAVKSVFR